MYEDTIAYMRGLGPGERIHGNVPAEEAAARLEGVAALHERLLAEQAPLSIRCFFCGGPAHPASGCQYTSGAIACGPCVRAFWKWGLAHINGKGRRNRSCFSDHAGAGVVRINKSVASTAKES